MKTPSLLLLLPLAAAPLVWARAATSVEAAPPAAPFAASEARTFAIDAAHSAISFRVMHKGVSWSHGRFNGFEGAFQLDEANPAQCSIQIEVDAASIDTNHEGRDKHLRSQDFFDTKQFPSLSFKSTGVKAGGAPGRMLVTGELEMLGQKKPVEVAVELVGQAEGGKGAMAGLDGSFTVKRSDFGMKYGLDQGALGDEVHVSISLEGVAR
jgi:polyisoprenoid-binding protein YceI